MGVERQQGRLYQRFLFEELEEGLRHDAGRRRRHRTCAARGAASVHGVGPSTSLDRTSDGGGEPAATI